MRTHIRNPNKDPRFLSQVPILDWSFEFTGPTGLVGFRMFRVFRAFRVFRV